MHFAQHPCCESAVGHRDEWAALAGFAGKAWPLVHADPRRGLFAATTGEVAVSCEVEPACWCGECEPWSVGLEDVEAAISAGGEFLSLNRQAGLAGWPSNYRSQLAHWDRLRSEHRGAVSSTFDWRLLSRAVELVAMGANASAPGTSDTERCWVELQLSGDWQAPAYVCAPRRDGCLWRAWVMPVQREVLEDHEPVLEKLERGGAPRNRFRFWGAEEAIDAALAAAQEKTA